MVEVIIGVVVQGMAIVGGLVIGIALMLLVACVRGGGALRRYDSAPSGEPR